MHRLIALIAVFTVFSAYSAYVVATQGYTGFIDLALTEPWGMQMLGDIAILVGLCALWMVADARRKGISAWPYVVASALLGSVGVLAYLIHGELKALRRSPAVRDGFSETGARAVERP